MLLEEVMNKAQINQARLAQILDKSEVAISKRIRNKSEIKVSELQLIEKATNKLIYPVDSHQIQEYDQVFLPYLEGFGETIRHPKIKERLSFDKELTNDIWFRPSCDLRIMTMQGNNMDAGEYPLANRDVLVIDTSIKNFDRAGMFVYTTNKLSYPAVAELKVNADGSLVIHHRNPTYSDEEYSPEDVKKMEFHIIGRMIKNMSLTK